VVRKCLAAGPCSPKEAERAWRYAILAIQTKQQNPSAGQRGFACLQYKASLARVEGVLDRLAALSHSDLGNGRIDRWRAQRQGVREKSMWLKRTRLPRVRRPFMSKRCSE
jgi:hypothetical protein